MAHPDANIPPRSPDTPDSGLPIPESGIRNPENRAAKPLTGLVLKALGLFGGVQCVSIACSLVRAKLIALWIGPIGVGLFGIFNSVIDMMSSATQLNLRQSAVRDISAASSERLPSLVSAVRWWARSLGLFGALAMILCAPILSILSFGDLDHWWGFAALSAPMFCLSLTSGEQALMQGSGALKRLARSTLWGIVGGTVASVPMFYYWGEGSIVPSIFVYALAMLIAVMLSRNLRGTAQKLREHLRIGKGFMRLGVYMTISSLATTAAAYAFLSYLNQEADTAVTGIYQAGYTLVVKYMSLVFTAIAMEYYPRLVKVVDDPRELSRHVSHEACVLMWIVCPVSAAFALCAPWIIRLLYSSEFLPALPMVVIGIVGAVFRVLSYCMSYVILAKGDGRTFVGTEVMSAAICLVLNVTMYRAWGMAGLGISYVAWYAVYTAMVWGVSRWRYGLTLTAKAWATSAAALAIVTSAMVVSLTYC